MVWQLQEDEALAAQMSPDASQVERSALQVSNFICNAPADFLEPLLNSPFGRVYNLFLERCCRESLSGPTAENRRNELSQQLRQTGCDRPDGRGSPDGGISLKKYLDPDTERRQEIPGADQIPCIS